MASNIVRRIRRARVVVTQRLDVAVNRHDLSSPAPLDFGSCYARAFDDLGTLTIKASLLGRRSCSQSLLASLGYVPYGSLKMFFKHASIHWTDPNNIRNGRLQHQRIDCDRRARPGGLLAPQVKLGVVSAASLSSSDLLGTEIRWSSYVHSRCRTMSRGNVAALLAAPAPRSGQRRAASVRPAVHPVH